MVRDLDVDAALLSECGLAEGHRLLSQMAHERALAAHAVTGQLYLLRASDIPQAWLAGFVRLKPDDRDAATVARTELAPLASEFFKAGRKAEFRAGEPARLHAFRLAAKRFRYTLEFYRPCYGPALETRIGAVREIQSLLGARQDCAVTAARLRALTSPDSVPHSVLAEVEARGARQQAAFRAFWQSHFDAPGQDLAWERYLARHAPAPRQRKPIE